MYNLLNKTNNQKNKSLTPPLSFLLQIQIGLTYHDAIAETGIHAQAISRLPEEMRLARDRRLKRAFDLSQKHVDIPESMREDAFREYAKVQEVFSETQKEHDERKHLNDEWWMPWHIGTSHWHPYDTKKTWFWNLPSGASKKKKPVRLA